MSNSCWEKREDEILIHWVKTYGPGGWSIIVPCLTNKTESDCKNRYSILQKLVNHENCVSINLYLKILQAVKTFANNWKEMELMIPELPYPYIFEIWKIIARQLSNRFNRFGPKALTTLELYCLRSYFKHEKDIGVESHSHIDKNDSINDPHCFYSFDSDSTSSSSSFLQWYNDSKDSSSSFHLSCNDNRDSSSSHLSYNDNRDSSSSHPSSNDNKNSSSSSSNETTDLSLLKKRHNVQIITVHDYQELRAYYAFLDKSNEYQQQQESINSSIQSIKIIEDSPSIPNQSEKTTVMSNVEKVPLYLHDLENLTFQSPVQSSAFPSSSTVHSSDSQFNQKTARVSSLNEEKDLSQQPAIPSVSHTNEFSIKLHKHHVHKQKRTTKSNQILVHSFSVSKHESFPVLSNQMEQSSGHL